MLTDDERATFVAGAPRDAEVVTVDAALRVSTLAASMSTETCDFVRSAGSMEKAPVHFAKTPCTWVIIRWRTEKPSCECTGSRS